MAAIERSEDHEIFDKVRRIKGECPNFYITGISIPAMQNLGMKLAETIEEENLIPFKGMVKHFTIKMPYFEDAKSGYDFLSHLKKSYSIARDCYDSYSGIILIEMSKEWIRKGYNSSFNLFLDYLQDCQQACFIILVPETKESEAENIFYAEFARCGIWMKVRSKTLSIEQCVELFQNLAEEYGFQVSDDAKKILADKLKLRKEYAAENMIVVQQLIKQIVFNRSIEQGCNEKISEQDIVFISGTENKKQGTKIGFTVNNR